MSIQNQQPTPHCVATTLGWVDKRSGEIIVSHRGLDAENLINLHGIARRDFVKVISKHLNTVKEEEEVETPAIEPETAPEPLVAEEVVVEVETEEEPQDAPEAVVETDEVVEEEAVVEDEVKPVAKKTKKAPAKKSKSKKSTK